MAFTLITHARIVPRRFDLSGIYCCSYLRATTIHRCVTPNSRVLTLSFYSQARASSSRPLKCVTPIASQPHTFRIRYMSSQKEKKQSFWQSISRLDRVKQVLRDYGGVAVLFHTSMSLCALGGMYALVDK